MSLIHVDALMRPAWLALCWCALWLVLTAGVYCFIVLQPVPRRRWMFHRPGLLERVTGGDVDLFPALLLLLVWVTCGLAATEWLRHASPAWPGAVLQSGVLLTAAVVLVNLVRHVRMCCVVVVLPAAAVSLMVMRTIWIWIPA